MPADAKKLSTGRCSTDRSSAIDPKPSIDLLNSGHQNEQVQLRHREFDHFTAFGPDKPLRLRSSARCASPKRKKHRVRAAFMNLGTGLS